LNGQLAVVPASIVSFPANSFWRQKRRLELAATTLAMPAAAIDNVGIRWTTTANQG
jgi:hypothetical protein